MLKFLKNLSWVGLCRQGALKAALNYTGIVARGFCIFHFCAKCIWIFLLFSVQRAIFSLNNCHIPIKNPVIHRKTAFFFFASLDLLEIHISLCIHYVNISCWIQSKESTFAVIFFCAPKLYYLFLQAQNHAYIFATTLVHRRYFASL